MVNFIIFSCGLNCENFLDKHMTSVRAQTYTNYTHILVDDASTDTTLAKLNEYKNKQTIICHNDTNKEWLYNSIHHLKPNIHNEEDVIVILDMDDWFANNQVLELMNAIYLEYQPWLTYSKLQRSTETEPDPVPPYKESVIRRRAYRQAGWRLMSLKTFKAFLFLNIDPNDFLGPDKQTYYKWAYDIALYMPMLEMCPPDKLLYIPEVFYIYNVENPLSPINREEGVQRKRRYAEHFFRSKPKYNVLKR